MKTSHGKNSRASHQVFSDEEEDDFESDLNSYKSVEFFMPI
jgi:hypothetical protein